MPYKAPPVLKRLRTEEEEKNAWLEAVRRATALVKEYGIDIDPYEGLARGGMLHIRAVACLGDVKKGRLLRSHPK